MHTYQPVRVPARAVALLALWLLACGSTEEYYEPEPYTPPPSYNPPSEPAPEPAPYKPAAPSQPTLPAYVPELDRNNVPAVPKTVDVTIQYGSPAKPSDDFWQTLSTRYSTAADTNNPNRGNPGDPLVIYDFKLGFGEHQVTLACVAETKVVYESGGSRRLAHGLGFCTWDNSRAVMKPNSSYSLSDPYTYCIGYFRDGKMHGPWAFNREAESRNGTQIMSYMAEYANNQANGEVRFFDDKGYLTEQCWAQGGVRHGTCYRWTADGSASTAYVGDVQYGKRLEFNKAGQLTRRGNIYDSKFYGLTEFWFPDAYWRYTTRYFDFSGSGGWQADYTQDGTLGELGWVEGAIKTGPYLTYRKDGSKYAQGQRAEGKTEGAYQRFHAEGWLEYESVYVAGKQTGPVKWYFKSGKVLEEGTLADNLRHGEFRQYREDGTLLALTLWENGNVGKTTYYDEQGNPLPEPSSGREAPGWTWVDNGEFRNDEAWGAAMAFHPETGHCLMFGGETIEESLNKTREFDGTKWVELQPRRSPPGRSGAVMYWDTGKNRLRVAGGYSFFDFDEVASEPERDVWEWDGRSWGLVDDGQGAPHEILRGYSAYDPQRKLLVVWGQTQDDRAWATFVFDGETWTRKAGLESTSPEAAQVVWDPSAGKVAIWLPTPSNASAAHRAMHFDGESWQEAPATLVPPDGTVFSACADAGRKGIWAAHASGLLFYDGTQWVAYEKPDMVNVGSRVLVDPKSGKVFVHGTVDILASGANESWWFDPDQGKRK